jgi:hypothetical protein
MLSRIPSQQLNQVPDADAAKRLAEEMQAAGRASLDVEVEKSARKSLKFLEHFPFLKYLSVGGHARDLDTLAGLTQLRELCLMRVTVPDFGFLAGLRDLKIFDMRFGGCKAFDTLVTAKNLIGLSFLRLPTLKNLDFVASMPDLQLLKVDSCKGVIGLPDYSANPKLRKIVLETMNGLESLAGVETAQRLEYLVVMEAKALPPSEFQRVTRCSSLRKVLVGLALTTSARYKEAIGYVPADLRMIGYYGTEYQHFSFDGYTQPAEPGAGA